MRKQVWILCVVVLLICMMLLLRHGNQPSSNNSSTPTANAGSSNQLSVLPQTTPSIGGVPASLQSPSGMNAATKPHSLEFSNEVDQNLLSEWQTSIEFYGKVVDENNNPVAKASVQFVWNGSPSEVITGGDDTKSTSSDADGLFALHGAKGPSLDVRVSKQGYYTSKQDTWSFTYALNAHFSPDAENPVVFHLRKKGQGVDLITSENGARPDVWARVPKDGTPVRVDFLQKKTSTDGPLQIIQIKPPWQTATNWSFSLSIADGGLIENQDEYQFAAPESDYQPTVQYDFAKSETNWITHVTKQFYFAFGEPRKYGWLRFDSDLAQETVFITYAINPTGSTDLEPK